MSSLTDEDEILIMKIDSQASSSQVAAAQQGDSFVTPTNVLDSSNPARDNDEAGSSSLNSSFGDSVTSYEALDYHWFYTSISQDRAVWLPFSYADSKRLEDVFMKNRNDIEKQQKENVSESSYLVPVKGGRFEVDLVGLTKRSIYWDTEVEQRIQRCLWFYRDQNDGRFIPYDQEYCVFLEIEYEKSIRTNTFHQRIDFRTLLSTELDHQESFVFHSAKIIFHYTQTSTLDEFGNMTSGAETPRMVKRGIAEVVDKVDPDEIDRIDHLCFVVHGIGEGCDMKFRPLVDCVDDFRTVSNFIIQSHFKSAYDSNKIGRIEYLPITWHEELHGESTGIDNKLDQITLEWIPKLRKFANTTILDTLFYTSPIYCQTIINKVGNEMNRLYKTFMDRNPNFKGSVSLIGHSLGSLILFDILSQQFDEASDNENANINASYLKSEIMSQKSKETIDIEKFLDNLGLRYYYDAFKKESINYESFLLLNESDLKSLGLPLGPRKTLLNAISKELARRERDDLSSKITMKLNNERLSLNSEKDDKIDYFEYGLAGTGQLLIKYPKLKFNVANFFALGSPIAVFLAVRGVDSLGTDFKLPKCPGFFNIFHPFDPVAYRIEPLVCADIKAKPVLMPHHLGRKRIHLEIKESIAKVGGDLKNKMTETFKTAWMSIENFTKSYKLGSSASQALIAGSSEESEIKAQEEMLVDDKIASDNATAAAIEEAQQESDIKVGSLNRGRRFDYVLQEKPIELINEYLFAVASHTCYWESEDTMLLIVKEIYSSMSVKPDCNLPPPPPGMTHLEQQSISIAQAAASTLSNTFSYFTQNLPTRLMPSASSKSLDTLNKKTTEK